MGNSDVSRGVKSLRRSRQSSKAPSVPSTRAIVTTASPAGQTIQSELNNAVSSALLGQKTPEQALADAQAAAMRAYDKVAG